MGLGLTWRKGASPLSVLGLGLGLGLGFTWRKGASPLSVLSAPKATCTWMAHGWSGAVRPATCGLGLSAAGDLSAASASELARLSSQRAGCAP